ncbi:hypothetical protein L208DRAFT_1392551 [Tricholoma matsutake]|nr:hypothetical protein L208DRAFT_1392551 [Tricholoma matsutake 945]
MCSDLSRPYMCRLVYSYKLYLPVFSNLGPMFMHYLQSYKSLSPSQLPRLHWSVYSSQDSRIGLEFQCAQRRCAKFLILVPSRARHATSNLVLVGHML